MLCYNKPMFLEVMIKLAICASIAVSALPLNTLKADSSSKFFVERMTASKYYVEHQFRKTGGRHHVEEHGVLR